MKVKSHQVGSCDIIAQPHAPSWTGVERGLAAPPPKPNPSRNLEDKIKQAFHWELDAISFEVGTSVCLARTLARIRRIFSLQLAYKCKESPISDLAFLSAMEPWVCQHETCEM